MFKEERFRIVLVFLAENGRGSLEEICRAVKASPATVRRDLAVLHERGLLRRTRGGAVVAGRTIGPLSFEERNEERSAQKERIALQAARAVQPGQSLFLDSGTTTFRMVRHLREIPDLFIATNSLKVALELAGVGFPNHILVGGRIYREGMSLVGPIAIEQIGQYRVDQAFLAVNGLTAETGATAATLDEALVKRRILSIARRATVVTDSSKIGVDATAVIAPLSEIDALVTDRDAGETALRQLREILAVEAV